MTGCKIQGEHCEQCGSTEYEDVALGDEGYSACCNEIVVWGPSACRNYHEEQGR